MLAKEGVAVPMSDLFGSVASVLFDRAWATPTESGSKPA